MAILQLVNSDHEEKGACWGGWGSKTQELGSLIMLWHYLLTLIHLPLGFLYMSVTVMRRCFTELLQHGGSMTKTPSCCILISITPIFIEAMTPMGCSPPMAQCYGETWESLSATPQWLWWMCLRLHSSLAPSHSASSPTLLHRWHLHCGLTSPWAFSTSLPISFHWGFSPNITLAHLIPFLVSASKRIETNTMRKE